jgi:hypothetical protein
MRAIIPYLLSLLAVGAAACGTPDDPTDGTGAAAHTLHSTVRPTRELASGGARIRGGGIRMDVQIGRQLAHTPTRSIDTAARPTGAVMP